MASERSPGGSWLKGDSTQEEALCCHSTLAASLKHLRQVTFQAMWS